MFRSIITLLMFCCISLHENAEELIVKNAQPELRFVVKGDTLMDNFC